MHQIIIAAAAVASQQPQATEPRTGEEIVVTGTLSAEPTKAALIGGSVDVIDSSAMERRQVREISDALRDVPGLAVSRVAGLTQVRIRGAEGNHTLVLVDGIEVSDPYFGEFNFGTLIADEGGRIEILRGQQSALYGSDAIGGVIHYLIPSGRELPGNAARIEAGSFGTANAAARVAGIFGTFDYALTGSLLTTDGVPSARGGERDIGSDNGSMSVKLNWMPASSATLTAVARYTDGNSDFNNTDYNPVSPTMGFTIDSPGSSVKNKAFHGLLRGEVDLLDGRWDHAISVQLSHSWRDGYDNYRPSFGNEGERLKGSYRNTLRLGTGALKHRLTFAAEGERESFRDTDPTGYAFTGWRHSQNLGLVGQYELFLNDNAAFGTSLRYDDNELFRDSTTYRVHGSYRLKSNTLFKAAAGSGVKNPGFYELFGYVDGRFIGNPNLRPEESSGWEAGIEQGFRDHAISLGATYFSSRLNDEIYTSYPAPNFVATPANRTTKSTQRGVEAFLKANIAGAFRIDANFTYVKARENGVEEVRRPRHSASLALDWHPSEKGGLTLVARYNGSQTDLAYRNPNFIPDRVRLDDYTLINLNGDLQLTDSLQLFARIENILDEEYEELFSFATPGRAAYAGVRARF